MSTKLVTRVAALILLGLFAWLVWPTPYFYRDYGKFLLRIHRVSGKVDVLKVDGWQPMQPNQPITVRPEQLDPTK